VFRDYHFDRPVRTNAHVLHIQATIEENSAGFRKLPGTALKNDSTGEVVYTPPQHADEIIELMTNLERFINDDELCDWDALTKMAVIHHQFESIHPFYDGNGRAGRIINILYLVKQGLLKIPVLYLSRYINQNKADYYRLLQSTRNTDDWQPWVLFMLEGVERTKTHYKVQTMMIAGATAERQILTSHIPLQKLANAAAREVA